MKSLQPTALAGGIVLCGASGALLGGGLSSGDGVVVFLGFLVGAIVGAAIELRIAGWKLSRLGKGQDPARRLEQLNGLKQKGLVTGQEYAERRKMILEEI